MNTINMLLLRFLAVITAYMPLVILSSSRPCYDARKDPYIASPIAEVASKRKAKKLLVWLHGTYGNGDKVKHVVERIHDQFPDCHVMAPHGPTPADRALEFNPGYQMGYNQRQFVSLKCMMGLMRETRNNPWISLDKIKKLYAKYTQELDQMRHLLEEQAKILMQKIKEKQKVLGLKNEDTIIVGRSQGAMLGLYLALTQEDRFLGVISLSGCLVPPKQFKNITTPICFIHSIADEIIPISSVDLAMEILLKQGITKLTFNKMYTNYPVGPSYRNHCAVPEEGILDAIDFIRKHNSDS